MTIDRLLAAVDAGHEEEAERLCHSLVPADEDALLVLARSADPDRRWWAVRGLAVAGSAAATAVVADALESQDAGLRAAALLTLGALQTRLSVWPASLYAVMAAALRDDDGLVRQVAGDVLARCGDAAVPALAAILEERHPGARTRAAIALGKIATMPAAAVLYQHLNDENYLVREYAYQALDEMGLLENQLYYL